MSPARRDAPQRRSTDKAALSGAAGSRHGGRRAEDCAGSSNSRYRLTGGPSTERVRELVEGLLNAVEVSEVTVRRAEALLGHVLLEWAFDHAEGPVVMVSRGVEAPLRPSSVGRPPSSAYRLVGELRRLGLPMSVEDVGNA